MNVNASKKTRVIQVGRWIARIGSIASIAFISFFVIAHLVGPEGFGMFNSLGEVVQFLFFPSGICLGMIIAWKWEGLGGFITTGSLIAFHVLRAYPIFKGTKGLNPLLMIFDTLLN